FPATATLWRSNRPDPRRLRGHLARRARQDRRDRRHSAAGAGRDHHRAAASRGAGQGAGTAMGRPGPGSGRCRRHRPAGLRPQTRAGDGGGPLIPGPLLFARYAFPPNERGYCGPADHAALHGYGMAGVSDPGLVLLARAFAGAWPYLQLIAAANRIADPLDARVVAAYWVGNSLLDNAPMSDFGPFLEEAFRPRAGRGWAPIAGTVVAGAVPHHSFHVFCVYPWTGLLRAGRSEPSLHVLDRCRIGWGRVV